ncbi:restriction endonuclease [Streptomyces sp. HPF1205]|uniref:restriction endonuclease n=1 Tax=Streptomyces sp. HPF1205 TaxID=2873262 RepID=UPI001CED3101|nr:restriction endonuclease [Streptomyces sp. HPF1205]
MATPAHRGSFTGRIVAASIAGIIGLVILVNLLANSPLVGVVVLMLVGAGAGGLIVRGTRRAEQRRLWERHQAQVRAAQSMEIARYHAMDPRQFEDAIAYLCRRDGCLDARRVGGAGDLGADVLATAPDGRRIVIQCKRYGPTTKVGSQDAQRFGGTCYTVHGAQVAVIVTTSLFTRPALDYAVRQGIRCFDERALAGWASRTGPAPWM